MSHKLAKENTKIYREMILWSCDNENNVSANYSNFITTLAGLFLMLSPLFIDTEIEKGSNFKIILILAFLFIFISLIFGGIYILLKKKFFSKWTTSYAKIFTKWSECETEEDEKSALSYEEGIYALNSFKSPQWPLVLQTIFLFAGILIEVLLIIIKIL